MTRKKAIPLVLGFAITVAIFAAVIAGRARKTFPIEFLRTYGSIHYIRGRENAVTFAFLAFDNLDMEKAAEVEFDSPSLRGQVISLIKSTASGGAALYCLNLLLEIDPSCDEVEVKHIVFDGTLYELGGIMIYCVDNAAQPLTLKSHRAASFGAGLRNYAAGFVNETKDTITITNTKIPFYDKASILYGFNGEEPQTGAAPVCLAPNDALDIRAEFAGCEVDGADVYYVAPSIEYEYEGKHYTLDLPYYTSGMNIDRQDFKELCQKYYSQE